MPVGPLVQANGQTNDITLGSSDSLSVTVGLNPGGYEGVSADWWIVALANGVWYYMDSSLSWTQFDGVPAHCHPVLQSALFTLMPTQALGCTGLAAGTYTFWFAVTAMDGVLDISEPMLVDSVSVTVQ
jgi:hypothetical protein